MTGLFLLVAAKATAPERSAIGGTTYSIGEWSESAQFVAEVRLKECVDRLEAAKAGGLEPSPELVPSGEVSCNLEVLRTLKGSSPAQTTHITTAQLDYDLLPMREGVWLVWGYPELQADGTTSLELVHPRSRLQMNDQHGVPVPWDRWPMVEVSAGVLGSDVEFIKSRSLHRRSAMAVLKAGGHLEPEAEMAAKSEWATLLQNSVSWERLISLTSSLSEATSTTPSTSEK